MLTKSELPENPVALSIAGHDGHHTVTAERVRGGKIRIACTCRGHAADGWCRHQIQLLCLRYDDVIERDSDTEFHFEHIVMGTPLADLADEVDLALQDFAAALRALDAKPPASFDGGRLRSLAELATDLAEAATHLDGALARFKKKLASGAA